MKRMLLALGADSAGLSLKNMLRDRLKNDERVELRDYGDVASDVDYPLVGIAVAEMVARGEVDRAILICGTGIGMAIAANKVPGIRATVAHDAYSAERSILSNNCQVLTMGARVIGVELAYRLVNEWLDYKFDETSPSARKVQLITEYEQRNKATKARS